MNVAMSVVYQYVALEASEVLKLRMSLLRPEGAETKEGTLVTRVATVACQWRTMEDEGGRSMDGVCATFTLAREHICDQILAIADPDQCPPFRPCNMISCAADQCWSLSHCVLSALHSSASISPSIASVPDAFAAVAGVLDASPGAPAGLRGLSAGI